MSTATATAPYARPRERRLLGRYIAEDGAYRQVLSVRLADLSHVVIDQRDGADSDMRLVGRIRKDEPAENDRLLAALYIDDTERRGRCQPFLRLDDLHPQQIPTPPTVDFERVLLLPEGARAKLAVDSASRWRWMVAEAGSEDWTACTLYQVVGWLDAYDPAVAMTTALVTRGRGKQNVCRLAHELHGLRSGDRVLVGPTREAVLRAMREQDLSFSEVAARAGYTKQDSSAIKRRLGLMPDAGQQRITNWRDARTLTRIVRAVGLDPVDVGVL